MSKVVPLETESSNRSSNLSVNRPKTPDNHADILSFKAVRQILKNCIEINRFRLSISFDEFMLGIVVISIFGNDFRLLALSEENDKSVSVVFSFIFVLFALELCLRCWACSSLSVTSKCKIKSNGYFLGFHFWLDVMVICSTFLDTSWAEELKEKFTSFEGFESWSRALRIMRSIRLIKIIRQIYNRPSSQSTSYFKVQTVEENPDQGQSSRIGAKLSEASIRRLTVVVLLSLSAVLLFTYSPPNYRLEKESFNHLHLSDQNSSKFTFNDTISNLHYYDDGSLRLVYLSHCVGGQCFLWESDHLRLGLFRPEEKLVWHRQGDLEDYYHHETIGIISLQNHVKQLALNNIFMMTFAIFNLFLGSLMIINDTRKLVIMPIQRMVKIVEIAAADPLADFQVSFSSSSSESEEYETKMLESTIAKISGLLRVGFGEAGAGIIMESLSRSGLNDSGDKKGVFQCPIGPGKRVHAIFGFVDIRGYAELTRCLGGDIMHFTNSVASIVHESVASSFGQNNRNLGSTFLNVWTIGDDSELLRYQNQYQPKTLSRKVSVYHSSPSQFGQQIDATSSPLSICAEDDCSGSSSSPRCLSPTLPSSPMKNFNKDHIDLKKIHGVDYLADNALLSTIKTICRTRQDAIMMQYKANHRLTKLVESSSSFPSLSFGLHAGWAIEGAVGSARKIDATYLSPHVNMTARLNSATRQYGTDILVSEDFVQLLSIDVKKLCRKIDVITVKGSEEPIGIYTFDLCCIDESVGDVDSWNDINVFRLQSHLSPSFRILFDCGLKEYLNGYWDEAIEMLERCNEMQLVSGGDGPSRTLVDFMKQNKDIQNSDWKGFRALTSK